MCIQESLAPMFESVFSSFFAAMRLRLILRNETGKYVWDVTPGAREDCPAPELLQGVEKKCSVSDWVAEHVFETSETGIDFEDAVALQNVEFSSSAENIMAREGKIKYYLS